MADVSLLDKHTRSKVERLRRHLDKEAWWVTEASRSDHGGQTVVGEHWSTWQTPDDQPLALDPALDPYLNDGGDAYLWSDERYDSDYVGPLAHKVLLTGETQVTVAGHIVRHDPARVLADVAAKKLIVDLLADRLIRTEMPHIHRMCVDILDAMLGVYEPKETA